MLKIRKLHRYLFYSALMMLLSSCAAIQAQVGFKASLERPPSFVSPYYPVRGNYKSTISPSPENYPKLSFRLELKPTVTTSSFENNSLRFETIYFRYAGQKKYLIPLSVDAQNYSNYNLDNYFAKTFLETSRRAIAKPLKKRRSGLGINVALPERFDKIFGEGGAGLKVSGYRKVTFAGRSQWTDAAQTPTFRQSKFPSLRMEQNSRFNITGTIGSKITVKVAQDSQTDIPLANRIQIRYKGDEDDILKTIEAGNTTLSLPNTKFVGYSSRIRGLFGIKTQAQVGNLTVTAIASQEKGSTEKTSISSSGQENATVIRDHQYEERRIFDLGIPGDFAPNDEILTMYIYESVQDYNNDFTGTEADFFVDPKNPDAYPNEDKRSKGSIWVKQIPDDGTQYWFYDEPDRNLHYVIFKSRRRNEYYLGYWAVIKRENGTLDTLGHLGDSVYTLKYLAPKSLDANPTQATWQQMWRNCYRINTREEASELNFMIFKGLDDSSTTNLDFQETNGRAVKYLEIFGLDQYNSSNNKVPDKLLDGRQEIYRSDLGLIIFPSRTPFDDDMTFTDNNGVETPPLTDEDRIPNIYNFKSGLEKLEKSNFYLQYSTKSRSNIIKLNRANIIENSERVFANGQLLNKDTDYNIQYDFGQITLISDRALDTNADITVEFEYAPFFAVQKKSLFGLRGQYELSKDFNFGLTFLYKSDKAQDRKPKVGNETARTIIYDADLSLRLHPQFLTKLVNKLPLIETESASNLAISAEIAQSHPNPNVENTAYVDDFEAAYENLSLGTTRNIWHHASWPATINKDDYNRGKIIWHNPRSLTPIEEVYNRDTKAGEGNLRTFRIVFKPDNNRFDTLSGLNTNVKSWGGIMRPFNNRVDAKRAQLFEVRAKASSGKLHFDFGKINEDVNGNGLPDKEDKNPENGAVTELEDIGLDGLPDSEEPGYDAITNPDPNGDNWYLNEDGNEYGICPVPGGCDNDSINWDLEEFYYEYLNGTEGNFTDPAADSRGDREIYDGNEINSYFTVTVDLQSDEFIVDDSRKDDWVTYRIPIKDPLAMDPEVVSAELSPDWALISHVRVWFETDVTQTEPDTIEVADWGFVQSFWQDSLKSNNPNASFVVASVSDEQDVLFEAHKTPNVEAYRDQSTGVVEPMRALTMNFENLNHNDSCFAIKDLITIERYSGYRNIEMYVHYMDTTGSIESADNVRFFFRIGKDEKNYYETYTTLHPGWWDDRNHVKMDFNELTAFKDQELKKLEQGQTLNVSNGKYRIFGNPSINEIRYFVAGIVSLDSTKLVSGTVWMDELRVTEVRKDVGTAMRFSMNGNMADFMTYSFNYENRDPYFRGLSSATRGGSSNNLGSGRTDIRLNYNISLSLHKLLPPSWGASLPVTYSYSKNVMTPLLRTNTDIVLPEETRKLEQSVNESQSISISNKFNKKGKNPLFTLFLNRLKTRFSYQRRKQRSVNIPYSFGESYNVNTDFDLSVKKSVKIPIFFWTKSIPILKKTSEAKLSLFPETWLTTARYNRNVNIYDDVNDERHSTIKRDFQGTMRIGYRIFDNLRTSFNYDTRRDLSDLNLVNITFKNMKDFKLGLENHYGQRFDVTYDPKLFLFLPTQFSFKSSYTDDWEQSNQSRRSAMQRGMSVKTKLDHHKLLGKGSKKKINTGRRRSQARREPESNNNNEKEKKKTSTGKPFYEPGLYVLRKLTGWINPVTASYGNTYNVSMPGMGVRPGLKYRFGFQDLPEVHFINDTRPQSAREGMSYSFSSGFNFLSGFIIGTKFSESVTTDVIKQGSKQEVTSTSWPDLSIRIQKFKKFPIIGKYINKIIDIFAPRTGYSKKSKQSKNIDLGFITSRSSSESFSPLISVNFKFFRSLSMSATYSLSTSEQENFNPASGEIQSISTSEKKSFAFTSKYSFRSPHGFTLPIFGKIKFKSNVNISVNIKYNSNKTLTSSGGEAFKPTADRSDFSLSPVLSYTFSRQIRGGITLRWQDTNDNYKNRINHSRDVQLWTEIRF